MLHWHRITWNLVGRERQLHGRPVRVIKPPCICPSLILHDMQPPPLRRTCCQQQVNSFYSSKIPWIYQWCARDCAVLRARRTYCLPACLLVSRPWCSCDTASRHAIFFECDLNCFSIFISVSLKTFNKKLTFHSFSTRPHLVQLDHIHI